MLDFTCLTMTKLRIKSPKITKQLFIHVLHAFLSEVHHSNNSEDNFHIISQQNLS